ncbi:MAG: InlB B-repeat-containing protein, partial [Bacteroidales bacterium]|nr:InlB B-repeat-containing protein [Bacteroidales bacterium]
MKTSTATFLRHLALTLIAVLLTTTQPTWATPTQSPVYTITIHPNGADDFYASKLYTGEVIHDYTIHYSVDDFLIFLNATKKGYDLFGWYENEDFSGEVRGGDFYTSTAKDIDLYAKWRVTTYQITYIDAEDGLGSIINPNPTSYTIESGIINLVAPSRGTDKFEGWYDNKDFTGKPITQISNTTLSNITLYAKWEHKYTKTTEIKTKQDLIDFSNAVKSGNTFANELVKLTSDIDFKPDANTENNFTAIGSPDKSFQGTFDGCGHTISGIRINKPSTQEQGLFGYVYKARVENVTLANAVITGYHSTGGIMGYNEHGEIINCTVKSDVIIKATEEDAKVHGGLVGQNNLGLVS